MQKNSTKKSLVLSVISLLLCISMLAGTTFAWFTDSVTSGKNRILAGNLDIELEYLDNNGKWQTVTEQTNVFEQNTLWEPGHTEVVYLRVKNAGSLAFKYQLGVNVASETGSVNVNGEPFKLSEFIEFGAVEGVTTPFADRTAARKAVSVSEPLASGYTAFGTMSAGATEQYTALVVFMPESVGNEANYKTGEAAPEIFLGIDLFATQYEYESDSFDKNYDKDAVMPDFSGKYTVKADVGSLDGDNKTTDAIELCTDGSPVYAQLPAGVEVDASATDFSLEVTGNVESNANIEMYDGQLKRSFDVHISGVSESNEQPMTVFIKSILPKGLKANSVQLYHVEDGQTVKMTAVDSFSAHNQYKYDPETGDVMLYIKSFSEIAAVVEMSDPWDGTVDTSWYNDNDLTFTLTTAEQLAGLGQLVSNGNTFFGKTIELGSDLDLGGENSQHVFYPIGYKSETPSDVYEFKGTFDGKGYRITDLYQNTWNIKGNYDGTYYNESLGLFAYLVDATVKNLIVENFILEGEFAPTGCIAGAASGGTFVNIRLNRCTPSTYNTGVGGIIGWDCGSSSYKFDNITIGHTNTIVALWGSWDVGCGGVMGHLESTSTATMTNCVIAPRLDVYNDVCANYQYYQYRYSGMLIGSIGRGSVPPSSQLTCSDCYVYYGDWANYYYCEFEKNSSASYTEDFQFSRVDEKDIVFDISGKPVSCTHSHTENEDKLAYHLPFDQLYTGYGWGATAVRAHPGVTVVNPYAYTITYMSGTHVTDVVYVENNKDAYSLKPAGDGYTWIDTNGNNITQIAADNTRDIVVYLNNIEKYFAKFVDLNGLVIYEVEFSKGATQLSFVPQVPSVTGQVGRWEDYTELLKNATGDIIIHPVYSPDENFEILGQDLTLKDLFAHLAQGKSVSMSQDLSGNIANASQNIMCVITENAADKDSRLDLNSFELTYSNDSNANKDWTLFQIANGCAFTVGSGLSGEGLLSFNFDTLNNNATPCLFDVEVGGTLVLERGVTIEIKGKYFKNVELIKGIDFSNAEKDYPGFNIIEDGTSKKIVVTGTTTLVGGNTATQN